jgi:hypothetical protein
MVWMALNKAVQSCNLRDLIMPMIGFLFRIRVLPINTKFKGILLLNVSSIGDDEIDDLLAGISSRNLLKFLQRKSRRVEVLRKGISKERFSN